MIKARYPHLHQISVVAPGFLTSTPIPKGIPRVALPFQCAAEEEATPSQPPTKEEEEVVEVSDSEDNFKIFNQPLSPEVSTSDLSHPLSASASPNQEVIDVHDEIGI